MSLAVRLFATPDGKVYLDVPGRAPVALLEYIASGLGLGEPQPMTGLGSEEIERILSLLAERQPPPAPPRKPRGPQKKQLKPRTPKP